MCCFSAKTEVFGTSIFARFTGPARQALVYTMQYAAETPTAMILPLPTAVSAGSDAVRFVALDGYEGFFDDLALGYPAPRPFLSRGMKSAVSASALPVEKVGDFIASFVPRVEDFDRLDARFAIRRDVWSKVPAYADYGFAVFQLEQLSGAPHPIALEFTTRMPETLFFPTVHIHDGSVHAKDQFDHVLYAQHPTLDAKAGSYDGPTSEANATGFVRSEGVARTFARTDLAKGIVDGDLLVHRKTMKGLLPNQDTIVDLRAIAATRGGCGHCDVGAAASIGEVGAPIAATVAGLAWIIRRRDARGGTRR